MESEGSRGQGKSSSSGLVSKLTSTVEPAGQGVLSDEVAKTGPVAATRDSFRISTLLAPLTYH